MLCGAYLSLTNKKCHMGAFQTLNNYNHNDINNEWTIILKSLIINKIILTKIQMDNFLVCLNDNCLLG